MEQFLLWLRKLVYDEAQLISLLLPRCYTLRQLKFCKWQQANHGKNAYLFMTVHPIIAGVPLKLIEGGNCDLVCDLVFSLAKSYCLSFDNKTIISCLNQSWDKQTIRAGLTWPCVPSVPLTVWLAINPQNESKGMMADMFIGCICCLQFPGPRQ